VCADDLGVRARSHGAGCDRRRCREARGHKRHGPGASPDQRKIFCPGCEREEIYHGEKREFEKRKFHESRFSESGD